MTDTLIKIENLHKSFGKNEVLKGINLEIKRGEAVSYTHLTLPTILLV